MTPEEFGTGLFQLLVVNRLASLQDAERRLAACSGIVMDRVKISQELLLMQAAVVDRVVSTMNGGQVSLEDCYGIEKAYGDCIVALVPEPTRPALWEQLGKRYAAYGPAFREDLGPNFGKRIIGSIERVFASFCGVPSPLSHEGFAIQCKTEFITAFELTAKSLHSINVTSGTKRKLKICPKCASNICLITDPACDECRKGRN